MHILFLCTANSARSIMAEAAANDPAIGRGLFRAFSGGSAPGGRVHPFALAVLEQHGIATGGLRSKSWDEFAAPGAPAIDAVITVCDRAASEPCPIWPGHPATAHWGVPDPAAAGGTEEEKRRAFRRAFDTLRGRIERLAATPGLQAGPGLREMLDAAGRD